MKKSWYEGNWNNKIHRKRMKNAINSLKQKKVKQVKVMKKIWYKGNWNNKKTKKKYDKCR